jgi:hypothetical protein
MIHVPQIQLLTERGFDTCGAKLIRLFGASVEPVPLAKIGTVKTEIEGFPSIANLTLKKSTKCFNFDLPMERFLSQ